MGARRRKRGFTQAAAEAIALELRAELGLGLDDALVATDLASHLAIPVMSINDIDGLDPLEAKYLTSGDGRELFSAATIYLDEQRRFIVVNPAHSDARKGSSICHEIGHVALEHEPESALGLAQRRSWNGDQEKQATYLAGALLVPQEAAHEAAIAGMTNAEVAKKYGVSVALAAMRMNMTGARRRAARRLDARARWRR